jgi:hypothetical protein
MTPAPIPTHDQGAIRLFCLVLLVAASVSSSLVFACATPFAALAVVAAATLPLRSALTVVMAAWLTNQLIGFGVLHYPRTIDAAAWGAVIAAAAAGATIASSLVFNRLASLGRPALYPIAGVASFATYELGLAAAVPMLGGAGAFSAAIIGRIALVNVVWLIGLVCVCEGSRFARGRNRAIADAA